MSVQSPPSSASPSPPPAAGLPPLDILHVYKQLATLPEVTGGWLLSPSSSPSPPSVLLSSTVRDIEQDTKREYSSLYLHSASSGRYAPAAFPAHNTETVLYLPSPSLSRLLIVRKLTPKTPLPPTAPPQYLLDVYSGVEGGCRLLHSLSSSNVHAGILTSGLMGCARWSRDEQQVLYTAEPLPPAEQGWYDEVKAVGRGEAAQAKGPRRGRQWEWKEDWGEQMAGVTSPRLFVLSLASKAHISPVEGVPSRLTVGGAVWCEDGAGLVLVGWEHGQRRLGVSFYNSRKSALFYIGWRRKSGEEEEAEDKQREQGEKIGKDDGDEREADGQDGAAAVEDGAEVEGGSSDDADWTVLLTPADHSPISPRFSPDGRTLCFASTEPTWHHWSGSRLRRIDWAALQQTARAMHDSRRRRQRLQTAAAAASSSSPSPSASDWPALLRKHTFTVLGLVDRPASVSSFPGLYLPQGLLPAFPWVGNSHLLLSSYWRHSERLLMVNVLTSAVTALSLPPEARLHDGSASVLHLQDSRALISISTPVSPTEVWLLELSKWKTDSDGSWVTSVEKDWTEQSEEEQAQGDGSDRSRAPAAAAAAPEKLYIRWQQVMRGARALDDGVQRRLDSLRWEVQQVHPAQDAPGTERGYCELPFDSLLLYPSFSASLPRLHLVPHGGPHSSYTTAWSFAAAFLCCCNFAVLLPNYRGSTGYGQASLSCLPGRCGRQDVDDCMAALSTAQRLRSDVLDAEHAGVMGGSHGGFLATHLIGQFPARFYCASARNPVVHVAAMLGLTDIPDWCMVETGLQWEEGRAPTAAAYAQMLQASPIAWAERVQTPLLLLLGAADRRVPMQQGIDYARLLRARGVRVGLLVYEGAQHGLSDKVAQEADVWVNTVLWMLERYGEGDAAAAGGSKLQLQGRGGEEQRAKGNGRHDLSLPP